MSSGIGDALRAARRRQGRSLADAAAETKVRETYLAALEEEDFGALGGDVYVKGFLRSYARFLGLDADPLIAAFRRDHERPSEPPPRPAPPLAPMAARRPPPLVVGAGAVVAIVLLFALVGLLRADDSDETVPPAGPSPAADLTPPAAARVDPAAEAAAPTDVPSQGTVVEVAGDEVVVEVRIEGGESYVLVRVDGEEVFEAQPAHGFTRSFTGAEEVAIVVGNAEPVTVVVNGENQGDLGAEGEVVTRTYRRS